MPVQPVAKFSDNLPESWSIEKEALFVPLYQREALWLSFQAAHWKPNAVMVGTGDVNALTGERWQMTLTEQPQNYLVCPEQPWLDGIKVEEGAIRQFVAVPLGQGLTISEQIAGPSTFEGLRVAVFEPRADLFPDESPEMPEWKAEMPFLEGLDKTDMGIGAGGKMKQKVYHDPYGLDTWNASHYEMVTIYLVNSIQYQTITGTEPPPTPISAQLYTQFGLPWFEIYDEEAADIAATETLSNVKPTQTVTEAKETEHSTSEKSLQIDPEQIKKLRKGRTDD